MLGTLLQTTFDVEYVLDDAGAIASHVRYEGLFGTGWLSTRGRVRSDGASRVALDWDDGWWDPDADAWGEPEASYGADWVRPLARRGVIPQLATFPVEYLDADLCSFVFPITGTRIVAVREGGALRL